MKHDAHFDALSPVFALEDSEHGFVERPGRLNDALGLDVPAT
jgi:hypothetical protein